MVIIHVVDKSKLANVLHGEWLCVVSIPWYAQECNIISPPCAICRERGGRYGAGFCPCWVKLHAIVTTTNCLKDVSIPSYSPRYKQFVAR